MREGFGPEMFFAAGAIGGRLRIPRLAPSGRWDPKHLTYRTAQELEALFFHQGRRGWVVRTVAELDHVIDCSVGVPAPITLYISTTLLDHAEQKWEGHVPVNRST